MRILRTHPALALRCSAPAPALAQDSDLVEDTSFLRVTIGERTVRLEALVVKKRRRARASFRSR